MFNGISFFLQSNLVFFRRYIAFHFFIMKSRFMDMCSLVVSYIYTILS